MGKDDEKLLRQLSLVSFLLSRRRPVTPTEIRRSVEGYATMTAQAFTRRFYDDREDLRRMGIAIEGLEGVETEHGEAYYLPGENYFLPDLQLTPEELRALTVAMALLEGRFAYARPLRLALVNLTRGHPDPQQQELDRVAVALAPDEEARDLGRRLACLDDAVARGKTVTFTYSPAAGSETTARVLDPYGLFRIGGHWYVVGRDHVRDDTRTFRLSRIQKTISYATKKPRDFTVPLNFDPAEFRARPPWLLSDPLGVARVRVDEDLAWWVERSFPRVTVEPADAPGPRVFLTEYSDEQALLSWIISLGRRAELLEPPELREQLRRGMSLVIARHREPEEAESHA
ncbi:MAG: WYL domain-containing protein [Thermoleophilia bacterium]|nr:WYL domain-containing protein [Thermoleophilia bacterium]